MKQDDSIMIGEAARILHRGVETVLRYEKNGRLPPARRQPVTNNRVWLRSVVEALALRLEMKA